MPLVPCARSYRRPLTVQQVRQSHDNAARFSGAEVRLRSSNKMRRGELWQTLIFEGMLNLFLAGAVLVWPAIAATAFMSLASIWAIATGALLLAAARQISVPYAPALLSLAGLVSITWGLMVTITGPSSDSASDTVGWWLIGYALPFAVVLLALARLLRRQHNQSAWTE